MRLIDRIKCFFGRHENIAFAHPIGMSVCVAQCMDCGKAWILPCKKDKGCKK